MGHIVVFESTEGVPAFHRCDELGDAVSFVEKLRNDRGVESVQIYRAEEIVFDFKPYYRVEIGELGAGSSPAGALPQTQTSPQTSPQTPPQAWAQTSTPSPSTMVPPPPITTMAAPQDEHHDGDDVDDVDDVDGLDELDAAYDDDLSGAGARRGLFGR